VIINQITPTISFKIYLTIILLFTSASSKWLSPDVLCVQFCKHFSVTTCVPRGAPWCHMCAIGPTLVPHVCHRAHPGATCPMGPTLVPHVPRGPPWCHMCATGPTLMAHVCHGAHPGATGLTHLIVPIMYDKWCRLYSSSVHFFVLP
jgi:hypothetical protein